MANNNETTTKFKVDISELVSGMQSAKRQIALANAEFKSATSGMDNWSKSADGVSAKLSQLDKTLSNQKNILSNLEDQYRLTVAQMGAGSKEAENLKIKIENQKASIGKTQKEIDKYTQSLSDIKAEANQSVSAIDRLSQTISDQESDLKSLKKAYADAVIEFGEGSTEARNLANQIDRLSSDLNDNKTSMKEATSSADKLDNSMDDVADSTKKAGDSAEKSANGGFTVLKGALANLVADGIKKVADGFKDLIGSTDQASNQFQASTGVADRAMGEFDEAIKNVYKNNFGESLQDVAEKMAKVAEVTGELDGSKLQEMTEAGITLEDTFGMDMTVTLRGVQSLMTHFGMSADEAFDLMASGAQNGLNYTDELGDNVTEYAGKFAEAGYSSDEYFQLLKNGAEGGAYNLDKVNDSINEVTARLADGTIEKGIGGFSQETQDLFKAWQEGGASQKDVINSIVADIQSTTNEQEKMNLSALAFGTMAEDGGTQFIQSLSAVGDTFDDVNGKMDEIKEKKYDDVMSQLSGVGRTVQTDLIAPFVEKLLPYIKEGVSYVIEKMPAITEAMQPAIDAVGKFVGWIVDNKDLVIAGIAGIATALLAWNVVTMIQGVVGAIKAFQLANEGATIAQWALNVAMNANPIGIIIALIAGLVAGFVILWNKSETFREFWIGLWEKCKETVSTVVEAIVGFFTGIFDFFKDNWQTILLFILNPFAGAFKLLYEKCEGFRNFVDGIVSAIRDFFVNLGQSIADIATSAWNFLVDLFSPAVEWFTKLFTSIYDTLASIVNVVIGLLKGCWEIICRVFEVAGSWFNEKVIQPVAKFFSDLWSKISDGAKKAWGFVSGVFEVVADWFNDTLIKPVTNFFSDMWEKLTDGASKAWSGIQSVFSSVAKFFGDIFSEAWQKVKDIFSVGGQIFDGIKDGIVSAFTTVVNAIIRGINKVVKIPFDFINDALNTIHDLSFLGISPFSGLWGYDPISIPQIPELYQGGVLKKGQTGYLEGDGDEAVVPLDKNTGWLDEVARRIVAKGGLTDSKAQTVNNNYNYEYSQTNNSPKALSRLEIYRQTRNQFNYAVGGDV